MGGWVTDWPVPAASAWVDGEPCRPLRGHPPWSLGYPEMRDAFGWDLDRFLFLGGYPGAASLVDDLGGAQDVSIPG